MSSPLNVHSMFVQRLVSQLRRSPRWCSDGGSNSHAVDARRVPPRDAPVRRHRAAAGSATHGPTAAWSAPASPKAPADSSVAAAGTPTKPSRRTRPVPWTGIAARGSTAEGVFMVRARIPQRISRVGPVFTFTPESEFPAARGAASALLAVSCVARARRCSHSQLCLAHATMSILEDALPSQRAQIPASPATSKAAATEDDIGRLLLHHSRHRWRRRHVLLRAVHVLLVGVLLRTRGRGVDPVRLQ